MLKRDTWWTQAHQDAYKRSTHLLTRQPWSSLMTIVMIAVVLMLTALCGVTTHQMAALSEDWHSSADISLYLKTELSTAEQDQVLQKIRALPTVESATLTTAEEGMHWLQQQEGMQNIAQYLPVNPLPAVIRVIPDAQLQTPEAIQDLYHQLQQFSEISAAKFDAAWAEHLYAVLGFLNQVLMGLICLFGLMVVLVIGNTLRLLIHHRSDEIQVLRLIGAPSKFIMRPFLYAALWYGLLAGLLAIFLADAFLLMLRIGLNQWAASYHFHLAIPLLPILGILGLLCLALILSWTAARLTLSLYI